MANAEFYPVQAKKNEIKLEHVALVGAGATDLTLESGVNGSFVTAATRTGAGTYSLTFRRTYPQLKGLSRMFVGTTAGLTARFSAFSASAGTATLVTEVGAVATDMAAADTLYLTFHFRNSGANG